MLDLKITDGFRSILGDVQNIQDRLADLPELAGRIAIILQEDNEDARAAGLDADGIAFEPISAATVKRRRRRGDDDGPPLSPNYAASRIQNPMISVERESDERVTVRMSWPNMPFLEFHVDGVPGRLPKRDPVGVTPKGWALIEEAVEEFISGSLNP